MDYRETLEMALQQLSEKMRRLDDEWQKRATSPYQHHEIATGMVMLWKHQAEEMLRMLYGVDKDIIVARAEDIRHMLEQQGWTITTLDLYQDNPWHGHVTAKKDDTECTYYFEYHRLADIERHFKRVAGEIRPNWYE